MEALLQALISGLAVGGAYALVALGFSITFTTTKTLNFSHGEFVSAGAFIGMSALFLVLGKPFDSTTFGSAIPGAGSPAVRAGAGAVGDGRARLAALCPRSSSVRRPARHGMGDEHPRLRRDPAKHRLGDLGAQARRRAGPVGDAVLRIGNVGVRPQELLMLGVAVVVMFGFDRVMSRTMMGKAMRAVAANGNVASLMGINTNAVMIGAFVISSALAGLSGFLLAPIAQASLYMGLAVGLKGFSGAMIGGLSNPRGCVIGGFLLGVLESLVNLWQAQWREVAVFALVILVLAFRPTGLFGKKMVEKV